MSGNCITCELTARIRELTEQENAELRAEVERLKGIAKRLASKEHNYYMVRETREAMLREMLGDEVYEMQKLDQEAGE